MFNYRVDPHVLIPHLPPNTELDLFRGEAIVSVVGFMFNNTKVFGLRWPFHTSFEEVNLRFYVKHFDGTAWKRGVVFKSEIVPRPLIALFANTLYNEHYSAKRMKHSFVMNGETMDLSYQWRHNRRLNNMRVTAETSLGNIEPGSEEEFIFEHYWGYNKYNSHTTIEYGVEHQMWQVHKVLEYALDCDIAGLYGPEFVPYLSVKPLSVFLAKGSTVTIRKPVFIR